MNLEDDGWKAEHQPNIVKGNIYRIGLSREDNKKYSEDFKQGRENLWKEADRLEKEEAKRQAAEQSSIPVSRPKPKLSFVERLAASIPEHQMQSDRVTYERDKKLATRRVDRQERQLGSNCFRDQKRWHSEVASATPPAIGLGIISKAEIIKSPLVNVTVIESAVVSQVSDLRREESEHRSVHLSDARIENNFFNSRSRSLESLDFRFLLSSAPSVPTEEPGFNKDSVRMAGAVTVNGYTRYT